MSAGFLLPWIILQQNGEILAAHCTCMAGYVYLPQCLNYDVVYRLGEACSHIAAIASCMINAREACQQTGADSCTSTLCGWSHSAREVRMNYACVVIM